MERALHFTVGLHAKGREKRHGSVFHLLAAIKAEKPMVYFTPWLSGTISGFVYLCAAFFLILSSAGRYDLKFLKNLGRFAPYIAVVTLFFSYALGLAAHFCCQWIYELGTGWLGSAERFRAAEHIAMQTRTPRDLLLSFYESYDAMALFRYLMVGFFLLAISLWLWLRKAEMRRLSWALFVACIILAFIFGLAWRIQRSRFEDQRQEIGILYPKPVSVAVFKGVDFRLETPIRIDPLNFDGYFSHKVTDSTGDTTELRVLASAIAEIRNTRTENRPDVRGVIKGVYSDGDSFTICMSSIAMSLDDRPVRFSGRIKDLLLKRLHLQDK